MKTGIKKIDLQGLVTLALFVAMDIVLEKISFGPSTVKVGLGFIGSALLGYYFGPLWGGIGALISDYCGQLFLELREVSSLALLCQLLLAW